MITFRSHANWTPGSLAFRNLSGRFSGRIGHQRKLWRLIGFILEPVGAVTKRRNLKKQEQLMIKKLNIMKIGQKIDANVRVINRHVFAVNGKYVIRTTNGWVKQIGVYTDDEMAAIHRTIEHLPK